MHFQVYRTGADAVIQSDRRICGLRPFVDERYLIMQCGSCQEETRTTEAVVRASSHQPSRAG